MALPEVPDWTQLIQLMGQYGGVPKLIATDENGQLYIVIQGELTGITGDVNVTQEEKDREIQGADGATLRTVAVDASGQIIMVPRGQSGNYMLVDASGYLTSVMKGLEGANLRTIAVDADGNIVGVFKGLYDSTLTTLKVDANGRLIAVLTDPEDTWGVFKAMGFAGLARVLSYGKSYDHRGDVFFMTSFENGIVGWKAFTDGTGAEVRHSVEQAKHGAYSCQLVAGSDGDRYARIKRYFHYPVEGKIGLEFSFTLDPDTDEVRAWLLYYDGTLVRDFRVKYDHTNTDLICWSSGGAEVTLNSNLNLFVRDEVFHTIKLVVDIANDAFVRVLCDGEEYDASAGDVNTTADTTAKRLEADIEHKGDAAINANIWVDDIILTESEPA